MVGKYVMPVLLAMTVAGGALPGSAGTATAATVMPVIPQAPEEAPYPPSPQPPLPPTDAAGTPSVDGTFTLTWQASTSVGLVVAYDIYASGSPYRLIATVPANVLTYVDTRTVCGLISYYIVARNAAGLSSPPSNVVPRTSAPCPPSPSATSTNGSAGQGRPGDRGRPEGRGGTGRPELADGSVEPAGIGPSGELIEAGTVTVGEESTGGGGRGEHGSRHGDLHARAHDAGAPHAGDGARPHHAPAAAAQPDTRPPGATAGAAEARKPSARLPFTGAPVAALLTLAAGLLAGGTAVLFAARWRRRSCRGR
ncbi:hypothetical protein [Sphaerisporangium corydalis]|uniref:Fibronectin type-III domain-containing protein n=1 Tax=Sphaerisporangium corydalis TaxID=1441875 RepID=A0ABV9EKY0_9ACTN|nr:hypothetical protein [Sphaerisporangium corydalis]